MQCSQGPLVQNSSEPSWSSVRLKVSTGVLHPPLSEWGEDRPEKPHFPLEPELALYTEEGNGIFKKCQWPRHSYPFLLVLLLC